MIRTQRMTVAEFDEYVQQSENTELDFEYIAGELVEVVSNKTSSAVAMLIGALITIHVQQNKLGYVTGADGGYMIMGERYIPDVAFISKDRQPNPSHDAYNPTPPDLTVEVLSPTNDDEKMRVKVTNYLLAGVVVWVVNPPQKIVEVYEPGERVRCLTEQDRLLGGDVLEGFDIIVKDIFLVGDGA